MLFYRAALPCRAAVGVPDPHLCVRARQTSCGAASAGASCRSPESMRSTHPASAAASPRTRGGQGHPVRGLAGVRRHADELASGLAAHKDSMALHPRPDVGVVNAGLDRAR